MSGRYSPRSFLRRRWQAAILSGTLALPLTARAEPPPVLPSAPISQRTPAVVSQVHDLNLLTAIALEKNTGVAAARASLAAAIAGQRGIDNLHVPTLLQPDLPIRRKQASLGVVAAEAGVRHAESLAVFGVQYSYLSYLFAREQQKVAQKAVDNLDNLVTSVKAALENKEEKTDIQPRDLQFLEGVRYFAQSKLTEAKAGEQKAMSALREAAGLSCDVNIQLRHSRLIEVSATLDKQHLIQLALRHRPELVQATINLQVCELEVAAQKSRHSLNVRTFASGADLHAAALPAGRYDSEYRPGVAGPEMPPFLSGKQCDRVARASAYAARAASVNERAQGLIVLEVEQAYLRATETADKLGMLGKGGVLLKKVNQKVLDRLRSSKFGEGSRAVLDELLRDGQVAAQVRSSANEARYQHLLALITLQRATGNAFKVDLNSAPELKDE